RPHALRRRARALKRRSFQLSPRPDCRAHSLENPEPAPGETFVSYIDRLQAKGYIPPDGRDWVDYIRSRSNDANHDLTTASRAEVVERRCRTGSATPRQFRLDLVRRPPCAAG